MVSQNLQQWIDKVNKPLISALKDGHLDMEVKDLHMVGNKAIVECKGYGVQKDGAPYQNNYAWFLEFSGETGKIVAIREYMNTALTKEMFSKGL